MLKSIYLPVLSVLFLSVSAVSSPVVNKEAPDFKGITSEGKTVSLSELRGKPVMLEWTNHKCPYVQKHYNSGNMQNAQKSLTDEGVTWISIVSSAPGLQGHLSPEEAQDLTARRGVHANMVVLDESGEIGKLYGAVTTPQMFLIGEDGVLRYMGAIDDKPSARPSSLEGATNYALTAWNSYKNGEPVTPESTKPYGCSVKYAE